MKIEYETPISEQIIIAQEQAALQGRKIKRIVLTREEMDLLKAEARRYGVARKIVKKEPDMVLFCGIRLEVEEEVEF